MIFHDTNCINLEIKNLIGTEISKNQMIIESSIQLWLLGKSQSGITLHIPS